MRDRPSLLLIFLGRAQFDARATNMLRSAAENGFDVSLIDISSERLNLEGLEKLTHFPLKIEAGMRFFLKYPLFLFKTYRALKNVAATITIASDVYSLPVAFRLKTPVVYDSREVYSQLFSGSGPSFSQKLLRWIENRFIKRCAHVLVTGSMDGDILKQKYGVSNLSVIKNFPWLRWHHPKTEMRSRFDIGMKPLVMYQGVLNPGRGLRRAIEVMSLLPDWHLVIAGDGPEWKVLQELSEKHAAGRIHFTGMLPYETLLSLCGTADIGWVFIEPISESYRLALPNKLFEFITAGVPVLTSDLPAIREVMEGCNPGLMLSHEAQPQEIAAALQVLYRNRSLYSEQCKKAAPEFGWQRQTDAFIKAISA